MQITKLVPGTLGLSQGFSIAWSAIASHCAIAIASIALSSISERAEKLRVQRRVRFPEIIPSAPG
jgi:hypothetical protein